MRITQTHLYFYGSFLSQWYKCFFVEEDNAFSSAEQYMMYHKALLFDKNMCDEILKTHNPKDVKVLGRKIKNFNAQIWDENKYEIIKKDNILKFSQNKDLLNELKKHKGRTFVEGSPVDCIYGVGLHWKDDLILDEKNWQGKNLLGKAITEVSNILC